MANVPKLALPLRATLILDHQTNKLLTVLADRFNMSRSEVVRLAILSMATPSTPAAFVPPAMPAPMERPRYRRRGTRAPAGGVAMPIHAGGGG